MSGPCFSDYHRLPDERAAQIVETTDKVGAASPIENWIAQKE